MKLKDAEKRLKQEPNNLGLRVQVAGLMREAGRSLEAVEHYRAVALAYRDQGRTQQAIAVCRSILEIAPEDAACQGLLAMLQQQARASGPLKPITPAKPEARITPPPRESRQSTAPPPRADTRQPTAPPPRADTRQPTAPPPRADTRQPTAPPPRSHEPSQPPRSHEPSQPPRSHEPSQPPRAPSRSHEPSQPPRAPTATMRNSPMPPAPEVPSLRPATNPAAVRVTERPMTSPPPVQRPPMPAMPRTMTPTGPRTSPPTAPPRPTRPPPMQHDPRASDPGRRSSMDETPLPQPVPYHVADRTSQPGKISSGDIDIPMDDDTRPESNPSGLAHAARRISGLISDSRGVPQEVDLSAELDTRQRRRFEPEELRKVGGPPPTVPVERVDDLDDLVTPPPPPELDELATEQQRGLKPHPRGSDDALTPPRTSSRDIVVPSRSSSRDSLPRIGIPPKTTSRPPAVVSIPPKSPSKPPGSLPIPPKPPSHPPGSLTPPGGTPLAKLRPGPPARPAMPKIPRDSENELTRPRDRGAPDKDDDD